MAVVSSKLAPLYSVPLAAARSGFYGWTWRKSGGSIFASVLVMPLSMQPGTSCFIAKIFGTTISQSYSGH
jgi:hypothetical protein